MYPSVFFVYLSNLEISSVVIKGGGKNELLFLVWLELMGVELDFLFLMLFQI